MIRKIKFILIVIVAIFMVSFIPNVYAEDENYYELRLYEKNTLDDFPDEENTLMTLMLKHEELLKSLGDETKLEIYNLDDKLLLTAESQSKTIKIAEKVIFSDNIEHTFTDDDKNFIAECCPELSSYSGVKLMFAEEPKDCNSVCIESVVLDSKSDRTKIISKPKYQDLTVKFDVKFRELNDYVKYKIVINNVTNEDYMISEKNNFGDSRYITYEYGYEGSNKVAKKNSKTVMYITIKYNQKVPDEKFTNGIFTEENNLVIVLGDDKGTLDIFKNPNTGYNLLAIGIIFLAVMGLSLVLYKTTNKKRYLSVFIMVLLLLPVSIYAMEKFQVRVDSKIQISKLGQFSFDSGCFGIPKDHYAVYQNARHYQYEGGMTWKEWEASEYNVDHVRLVSVTPIYVSPELIECQKWVEPNSDGSRPFDDLDACDNKFGIQFFDSASLMVSEGLYYLGYPCGN